MLRSSRNDTPPTSELYHQQDEHHDVQERRSSLQEATDVDLLDIANLVAEYGIETLHILSAGVSEGNTGQPVPVSVGDGQTGWVFQHQLTDDVGHGASMLPRGTIVAVKQFVQRPIERDNQGAEVPDQNRPTALASYAYLAQEIQVLCHDRLRRQENIIDMLFLGYLEGGKVPLLALELAQHGSLDFVLRCPGYGPSVLERENLTLDIALGLHALHACGIAHGDLKMDNILVFAHPERRVVAKLADFGGSCFTRGDGGSSSPRHHTAIWDSPERLLLLTGRDVEVMDWKKADVYSFGLVLASLWMRTATYQPLPLDPSCSTCVVERLVQRWFFTESGWALALKVWKLRRDDEDNSVVSEATKLVEWTLASAAEADALPFISPAIQGTLRTLPSQRWDMDQLLRSEMWQWASSNQVRSRQRTAMDYTFQTQEPRSAQGLRKFKVWSQDYYQTPYHWKANILDFMRIRAHPLLVLLEVDFSPLDLFLEDASQTEEHLLSELREIIAALLSCATETVQLSIEDIQTLSRYALHIAMSYLLGLGTECSSAEGHRWLSVAALCGNVIAMTHYCEIYDVHGGFSAEVERKMPINVLLTLVSLAGSNAAVSKLKRRSQNLSSLVVSLKGGRPIDPGRGGSMPFMMDTVKNYLDQPREVSVLSDLFHAVNDQDVESTLHQLAEMSAPSLHWLAYAPPRMAVILCNRLVEHGCDLAAGVNASDLAVIVSACRFFGMAHLARTPQAVSPIQPLALAIETKNEPLTLTLIGLHEQRQVPVRQFCSLLNAAMRWHLSTVARRLMKLAAQQHQLCQADGISPLALFSRNSQRSWVYAALCPYNGQPLRRLAIHGNDAEREEADTLEAIFNSLDRNDYDTFFPEYITACLQWDQVSGLKVGLGWMRRRGYDPSKVMESTLPCGKRVLQLACTQSASRCAVELVSQFSALAMETWSTGSTALHTAAVFNNLVILEALLRAGGIELTALKNSFDQSALEYALYTGNLEAATLIYEYARSREPAHTGVQEPMRERGGVGSECLQKVLQKWNSRGRSLKLLAAVEWLLERRTFRPLRARRFHPLAVDDIRPGHAAEEYEEMGTVEDSGRLEIVTQWHDIISQPVLGLSSLLMLDKLLLRLLFSTFPGFVNFADAKGWNSLHTAVWNGHVSAVELLLSLEHVDVNAETGMLDGENGGNQAIEYFPGRTALNLATEALMRLPPQRISRRGFQEIRDWEDRLRSILRLLSRSGAKSGSGASRREEIAALRFTQSHVQVVFTGLRTLESQRHRNTYSGAWPEPLGAVTGHRPTAADGDGSIRRATDLGSVQEEDIIPAKDGTTWWSSAQHLLRDHFDKEYGFWPDLPWLKNSADLERYRIVAVEQARRVSELHLIDQSLTHTLEIRLGAGGRLCTFDKTSETWDDELPSQEHDSAEGSAGIDDQFSRLSFAE